MKEEELRASHLDTKGEGRRAKGEGRLILEGDAFWLDVQKVARATAKRLVRQADLEDAIAETVLRVLEHLSRNREVRNPIPFYVAVAKSVCRRLRNIRHVRISPEDVALIPSHEPVAGLGGQRKRERHVPELRGRRQRLICDLVLAGADATTISELIAQPVKEVRRQMTLLAARISSTREKLGSAPPGDSMVMSERGG